MWANLYIRSGLFGFAAIVLMFAFAHSGYAQSPASVAVDLNERYVVNTDKTPAPNTSKLSVLDNPTLPNFNPPFSFTPGPVKPSIIPPTTPTDPSGPTCTPNKNGAPCGGGGPAALPKSTANTGAGNPIDVISGNKYQLEVDLAALPGVLGVEVVRHYNSASSVPGAVVGMMGRGWRLSYETRLHVSDNKLQILQADGARIIFMRDPKNPSLCASSDSQKGWVVVNNNRASQTRADPSSDITYTWHWVNGKRLSFNANGALTQIVEPTGEFLTLQYDPAGRLLVVTDPAKRSLEFFYAPQSHRVARIKTPLGVIQYERGQGAQIDSLVGALLPGIKTPKTYHYEDARWPNHLTGISQVTRLSTYLYDEEGRAVLSTLGHPAKLAVDTNGELLQPRRLAQGTGVEQVHLQYVTRPTYTQEGVTLLTNALAQTTTFKHRIVGGEYRLIEARGEGCAQCGPVNVRYAYDEHGRIVSMQKFDPNQTLEAKNVAAHKWSFVYDTLGRLATQSTQDRFSNVAQITLSYLGDTHLVERVARPSVVKGAEHTIEYQYNRLGQAILIRETGYAPGIASVQVAPRTLERVRKLQYKLVNGRSVLHQVFIAPHLETAATTLYWNASGDHILKLTQDGGRQSELKYDALGRVVQVRNQEGALTQSSFNEAGLVNQVVFKVNNSPNAANDALASTQKFTYNERGQLIETKDSHGLAQAFGFDAVGRPLWHAWATGLLHQQWLNAESQVVQHGQFMGGMQRVSTQSGGFEPAEFSPTLYPRQILDDFGRVIATISPATGTTLRDFDPADRMVGMQDAMGNKAIYEYDTRGRIVKQRVSHVNQESVIETLWTYEGNRLVQVTHPTQSERFEYNIQGQKTARHVYIHRGAAFQSSASQSLSSQSSALPLVATTRYHYNPKGELASVQWPDGSLLLHERDGQGQLVAVKRTRVQTPWLRWISHEQAVVQNIERDLIGVRSYLAGNGLQTQYIRSQEGNLARVVHGLAPTNANKKAQWAVRVAANHSSLQREPVLDFAYLWDPRGNLLYQQQGDTKKFYAYDQWNQLLAAVESDSAPKQFWRYAYNNQQQRVLQQESTESQEDLKSGTEQAQLASASEVNANGQPLKWNGKQLKWDARGRLTEVTDQERGLVASYTYDHRGLRIAKSLPSSKISSQTEIMLYSETREPLAQVQSDGTIERQYFYLAGLPLVVVEGGGYQLPSRNLGESLESANNPLGQIWRDLKLIVSSFWQVAEQLQYLHNNHLGAPQAVTNQQGHTIWQANYSPFGQATVLKASSQNLPNQHHLPTQQNLRLPGQWFDQETGLHYNRARYYDPKYGRYLSPDPLGNPDGPNPYAYVANNPLLNIDPDGLILFAFDGTNNSNPPPGRDDFSNVYKFFLAYDEDKNGRKWYMNGPGRNDPDSGINTNSTDELNANTARARVDFMLNQFDSYARETLQTQPKKMISVDIVGFSRGAAMARDFSNRLATWMSQDPYGAEKTKCVELRFLGLWDTVAQFGANGLGNSDWQLAIPTQVKNVYHAVAANENRYWFPGESISRGVQRGFIGSHADVGGSYGTGDLSDVALNWIVEQAKMSNIEMQSWDEIRRPEWGVVTNPVLHDKSNGTENSAFCLRANNERWTTNCTSRRQANFGGLTQSQSVSFISFTHDNPRMDADGSSPIVGNVNMQRYSEWLQRNYNLRIDQR